MATTTTYDIRVRYMLDDKASKGLAGIAKSAEESAKKTGSLTRMLGGLAAGAAGFLSFKLGKKLLIDYNSELQNSKVQMSGLLQMNMGGEWARNQERANALVRRFQDDAKASVGTTKDFVNMGAMLTGPLSRAGSSIEEIADVTRGAVIASQAFGVEAESAARDIESALQGTLSSKDRFARALLEPMGLTTDKWNKMVKESPQKANKALLAAFNQPAIRKMAEEQGKSWDGITSTLEDNLQRAFGKIGLPLMQRLGAEMQHLTDWLDKNPQKVKAITDSIANGLIKAFEVAKSIFGFIIEHKDLLLLIAKAALVSKAVGGVAGGIAKLSEMQFGLGGTAGPLQKFTMGLQGAVVGLSALALGASAIADLVDRKQTEHINRVTENPLLREQARLLGGASAGRGTGISSAVVQGNIGQAMRAGLRSDKGAIGADATGWLQQSQRRMMLAGGVYTAGDKAAAMGVASGAREAGLMGAGGSMSAAQVAKLRGNFGVGTGPMAGMGGAFSASLAKRVGSGKTVEETLRIVESLNQQFGTEESRRMEEFLRGLMVAQEISAKDQAKALYEAFADAGKSFLANMKAGAEGDVGKDRAKASGKKTTNVTIQKIQVVSDDPDRFAYELAGAFENYVKSPTQAMRARREG